MTPVDIPKDLTIVAPPKFCGQCGSANIAQQIPADDNRLRLVCNACTHIHYVNPKNVVGTIPVWENKVLLCRRAISPRYGKWTLPAGFMENGETIEEGAARETAEEANARVNLLQLYAVYSLPHISQVYMLFRAQLLDLNFSAGAESLDVRLFEEHEIPWDELAFLTVRESLTAYFADLKAGNFLPRVHAIAPMPKN
jgi:ADP-ribose pyrophosphatase YjhB (NUDIX family)